MDLRSVIGAHFLLGGKQRVSKRMRKITAIGLGISFSLLFVVGCGSNGDTNPYTPVPGKPQLQIEPPYVCSLGSKVVWDECKNAIEYDVYFNGKFDGTTSDCFYSVKGLGNDVNVTVKAKNGEYASDFSNVTTVFNNFNISESETLEIQYDNYDDNEITVPSSIRSIVFQSDVPTEVITAICIENRTSDLIISLKNVTLKYKHSELLSVIRTKDASLNRVKHNWSLIFNIAGECGINASGNYGSPPSSPSTNSGANGSNGNDGLTAVRVTSIVVNGDGKLTVSGGVGQDGARGADANLLSTKSYGHGGNGGNGGNAVECKHLLIDMQDGGTCTLAEGKAGKGGAHGSDAKGITSNVVHFTHTEEDCNGKDGNNGQSIISSLYELGGKLIRL